MCRCISLHVTTFQAINDQSKKNRALQAQLKELNGMYEEEQRQREEQHDMATRAEKRGNDLQLEMEELRASIEQVCVITYFYIVQYHCTVFLITYM